MIGVRKGGGGGDGVVRGWPLGKVRVVGEFVMAVMAVVVVKERVKRRNGFRLCAAGERREIPAVWIVVMGLMSGNGPKWRYSFLASTPRLQIPCQGLSGPLSRPLSAPLSTSLA